MTGTENPDELPRALPSIPVGSPGDRLLRESLAILRDRVEDRETREKLTEIIEGRRPALDLLEMPAFEVVADEGVAEFDKHWSALSDEERAAAAAAGNALFENPPPLDEPFIPGQPPAGPPARRAHREHLRRPRPTRPARPRPRASPSPDGRLSSPRRRPERPARQVGPPGR